MNSANLSGQLSPWLLFIHADIVVRAIIVLLALASVLSWAVIVDKTVRLGRLSRRTSRWFVALSGPRPLARLYEATAAHASDPFARIYHAILGEWDESVSQGLTASADARDGVKERVNRVAQIANGTEIETLQKGLGILATIGSVAPFVGLFGTVWGIIHAFQGIASTNNTSLAVVAPGIAEALFATALGLVAAIPAVVAYNRATGDLNTYAGRLGTLTGVVEVQLSRVLDSGDALALHEQGEPQAQVEAGRGTARRNASVELAAQAG